MKHLLEYLLSKMVDHTENLEVEEQISDDHLRFRYVIHANSEDYGRIIGKHGRIIRAIRDLVKLVAAKDRVYADVVLAEETS